MATRRVEAFLFPLLLLLLYSSCLLASSSRSDPEKKRCAMECRGIPEQQQRKLCVHRCLDHSGEQESGRAQPLLLRPAELPAVEQNGARPLEVLERFARRSDHLLGVDNYRLAVLEAEPQTFIMPCHWDAEQVVYVMQGRGTITLLHEERRESHDIKRRHHEGSGGVIVYAINKASNESSESPCSSTPSRLPGTLRSTMVQPGGIHRPSTPVLATKYWKLPSILRGIN
ncbi:unnamed protein product [Musa acuminata subsp. burmannicoides]